jgi:hypothetical protein
MKGLGMKSHGLSLSEGLFSSRTLGKQEFSAGNGSTLDKGGRYNMDGINAVGGTVGGTDDEGHWMDGGDTGWMVGTLDGW